MKPHELILVEAVPGFKTLNEDTHGTEMCTLLHSNVGQFAICYKPAECGMEKPN